MSTVKEIQAVRNACTVLDAIAVRQPVGVSDLARVTGLDKSGVHRIAVTLHAAGWIRPTGSTPRRWELSPTFARIARAGGATSLAAGVRPAMHRLRDMTGETVLLVVLDVDRPVLAVRDAVESHEPVRLTVAVGTELPVEGSAAARAIAAHLPPRDLARVRDAHPGLGDDRALAAVRRRGWASNDGEVAEGARAVAAPLLADDGYPVGALVVCGPSTRIGPARMRHHGRLTADVAAEALGDPSGVAVGARSPAGGAGSADGGGESVAVTAAAAAGAGPVATGAESAPVTGAAAGGAGSVATGAESAPVTGAAVGGADRSRAGVVGDGVLAASGRGTSGRYDERSNRSRTEGAR